MTLTFSRLQASVFILAMSTAFHLQAQRGPIPSAILPNHPVAMQLTGEQVGTESDLPVLLEAHGRLLNQAIVSASRGAYPDVMETNNEALLNNASQIANVFTAAFGPQAGKRFESLFNEHISLGSDYINAVKTNNPVLAQQISSQALENGRMIANFFNQLGLRPQSSSWESMLDRHVELEAQQTKAYFLGEFNQAIDLRDQSLAQLKIMANELATAIARQKPAIRP
ncbi:hypothetical protein [Candidatus Protochlamydia phocaeensis]|uniref:hypothetical protein n=1 Tax=Candidatus Protochlamydia phocaeensis TaxID=1414722 RepID=UPI0008395D25|nr:hypothetical protein [Candidatus Protochlamydia phocaeensis]